MITCTVVGAARPAGALVIGERADGSRFLRRRGDAALSRWQRAIAEAAAKECAGGPGRQAMCVNATFFVARPSGHFGKRGLRPTAPLYPTKRSVPDVDKLARAVLDALTGVVYVDDSQVVELRVLKVYADDGPVRAVISFWARR